MPVIDISVGRRSHNYSARTDPFVTREDGMDAVRGFRNGLLIMVLPWAAFMWFVFR